MLHCHSRARFIETSPQNDWLTTTTNARARFIETTPHRDRLGSYSPWAVHHLELSNYCNKKGPCYQITLCLKNEVITNRIPNRVYHHFSAKRGVWKSSLTTPLPLINCSASHSDARVISLMLYRSVFQLSKNRLKIHHQMVFKRFSKIQCEVVWYDTATTMLSIPTPFNIILETRWDNLIEGIPIQHIVTKWCDPKQDHNPRSWLTDVTH
jgi:hypothetical protein